MASRNIRLDLRLYEHRDDKLTELAGGDPDAEDPDTDISKNAKIRELIDEAYAREKHVEIFEVAMEVAERRFSDGEKDYMLTREQIQEKYGSDEYMIDPKKLFKGSEEAKN